MDKAISKNGVSVWAYKGDAMTLLAFDLDKTKTENFAGFSIRVTPPGKDPHYIYNRLNFSPDIYQKSGIDTAKVDIKTTEYSPIQTFRWVHTPATNHNINDWIFGNYIYEVTPRYLIKDVLQKLDNNLTIKLTVDVSPFKSGSTEIAFTRGFIESQAYSRHFGNNNATRPNKTDLLFDITKIAGPKPKDKQKNPNLKDYTYEEQHRWLGWQARQRIVDLFEVLNQSKDFTLDVFAFDLDEPFICQSLLNLAKEGRCRIILDNSSTHIGPKASEDEFEKEYNAIAQNKNSLVRGNFISALAHSKIFILKKNDKAIKVLTGSTNFSTNGLYINANHIVIFNDNKVADLYEQVFEKSFGQPLMNQFKETNLATDDFSFGGNGAPEMTIRFSPHKKTVAEKFFSSISQSISNAKTDVLFAIMKDNSASQILDAVKAQVKSDKIFTYGITDTIENEDSVGIMLYKPNSKRGIRVVGKGKGYVLPKPWDEESKIPGISIHHKFIVVDFKGPNPVVYCGSSNLAFGPEQKNGDNLLAIYDREIVTAL